MQPPVERKDVDKSKMEEMQHSSVLFLHENGHPLRFYAVPSEDKAKIKPLIEVRMQTSR